MKREYNDQAFTPEQVQNGELKLLLDYLMTFNETSKKSYMDIHITSDGYCTIVEWTEVHYDFTYECGKFQYVPGDGCVVREFFFPDNHSEFLGSDEEFQESLKEWLAQQPYRWYKDDMGIWHKTEDKNSADL